MRVVAAAGEEEEDSAPALPPSTKPLLPQPTTRKTKLPRAAAGEATVELA